MSMPQSGILVPPTVHRSATVWTGTGQTAPTGSYAAMQYDTVEHDTAGLADLVTNPTRLTIPADYDGYAQFNIWAGSSASGTNTIEFFVYKNGALQPIYLTRDNLARNNPNVSINGMWTPCAAGDYFEVMAKTSGGTARTVNAIVFSAVLASEHVR